jgi:hypothetical protein
MALSGQCPASCRVRAVDGHVPFGKQPEHDLAGRPTRIATMNGAQIFREVSEGFSI